MSGQRKPAGFMRRLWCWIRGHAWRSTTLTERLLYGSIARAPRRQCERCDVWEQIILPAARTRVRGSLKVSGPGSITVNGVDVDGDIEVKSE